MPNLMRDLTTVSIRVCVESFMLRCMAREAAKSHGPARNNTGVFLSVKKF